MSDVETITNQSIVCEWLKVAARQTMSAQLIHDMDVRILRDMMRNQLIHELSTRVLAHQVEEVEARDSAYWLEPRGRLDHLALAIEVGQTPRTRTLTAAAALIGVVVALTTALALGVVLCVVATLLIALDVRGPRYIEREKTLIATTKRWATFPENTYVYPDHMGPPRYVQMQGGSGVYEGERRS